jgi:hypothetical protein
MDTKDWQYCAEMTNSPSVGPKCPTVWLYCLNSTSLIRQTLIPTENLLDVGDTRTEIPTFHCDEDTNTAADNTVLQMLQRGQNRLTTGGNKLQGFILQYGGLHLCPPTPQTLKFL